MGPDIGDMLLEVGKALLQRRLIRPGHTGRQRSTGFHDSPTAMKLERTQGRHHHPDIRTKTGRAALNIEELFRA